MASDPRQSRTRLLAIAACLAAGALTGCGGSSAVGGDGGSAGRSSPGSTAGEGTGGNRNGGSGAGGLEALAGAPGSAGAASVGGASNVGGAASLAGAASLGGAQGSAGAPGLGGAAGSSGSLGIAGSAGGNPDAGAAGGGVGGAASTCPPAIPLSGGQKYCSNKTGNAGGGYAYELWASGSGSGCMTVYGADANFSATWSNVGDFLARIGLGFDKTKTPLQIGTISADFAETKTGGDGLVYVGIYGWTVNPLREYYILDDWGSTKPAGVASDGTPRDKVGTITVDGASYDVWKKTRVNKPAITGDNMTFDQYFSIRQSARQCGHISISEHFSKWIGLGLQLGNLEEAKLLLEAQDGSGSINFTTATVTVK